MGSVYEHDPEMAPDSEFELGRLDHLVAGNDGRLLDARRTPMRVVGLRPELAFFEVEVLAFEDRGARWELPMDAVGRFQFTLGATVADAATLADYTDAVAWFDEVVEIPLTDARWSLTLERLTRQRVPVRDWFKQCSTWAQGDRVLGVDALSGDPRLFDDLAAFMASRKLTAIETAFTRRYVSNPHAGEEVKSHAVVAAELGLAAYRGPSIRDPASLNGDWSRLRRAEHDGDGRCSVRDLPDGGRPQLVVGDEHRPLGLVLSTAHSADYGALAKASAIRGTLLRGHRSCHP